jgi:hypothetical protein
MASNLCAYNAILGGLAVGVVAKTLLSLPTLGNVQAGHQLLPKRHCGRLLGP